MTIQESVKQAAAGEGIDPSYLEDDPYFGESPNRRFGEIMRYMASIDRASPRRAGSPEPCPECGEGVIIKLEAKVPGAVRYDGCCTACGKREFHRAGWLSSEVRDSYRAAIGSLEVG